MARTSDKLKSKEKEALEKAPDVQAPETPKEQSSDVKTAEQSTKVKKSPEATSQEKTKKSETVEQSIPASVERLMKLYPNYSEFYVTRKGFVHPVGASKSVIKDAILYKNKYFNK